MNPAAEPPATDRPPSAPWGRRLWEPCDIASVVFFRIAFAGVILSHVAMALRTDWIDYYFASSRYHLTFYGFEWVEALDGAGMRQIHRLMGAAAVGVGLGLFYRLSAVLLFGTFTYTLLSEAALYQNHYYLVSLIAFALILIPAHRAFSVDAFLFPRHSGPFIPNWCRWLLMFLVALPYTYGGIAKLNSDWLNAMPLRIWIPQKTQLPVIGPLMAESWMPWVLSYGGLVLDLAIVPLLLWRKTRVAAYIVAVLFHLLNSVLFSIDVFPWMMLLLTTIFFAPDWPRRILRRPSPKLSPAIVEASRHPSRGQRIVLGIAAVFVAFQLLFPFRHLAYPGDASWTEEGQNFSWRMMLHHKDLFLRFYARDGVTGRTVEIPVGRLLTRRQLQVIARSPEQIAAVSQFLAEVVGSAGFKQVEIRAVAITSLNGRKPQLVFDPDLDLLTVTRSWKPQAWIHPLTEPLRADPWNVPSREWAGILGVELPVTAVPPERAQPGQPGPGRAP